jgi:hypothetical protein
MTHQEAIAHCITALLAQSDEILAALRRGDALDKLLRTYDGFSASSKRLYKTERAREHYKMSVKAYHSGLLVRDLYPEHRIPLSIITKRLLESDRTYQSVVKILNENEVILITKEEARFIDKSAINGGLGLRTSMPGNGICRIEMAQIQIAPETLKNHL